MAHNEDKVILVSMLAGKLLLENGAETYRVEDTMTRIALHYGLLNTHSFVTPTAIIFSLNEKSSTRLTRITNRTTDLEKITETNAISRAITSDLISLDTAHEALKELEKTELQFSLTTKVLAAALCSAAFLIMFKGNPYDLVATFIAGGLGLFTSEIIQRHTRIRFFSEFAGAVIIGIIAHIALFYFGGHSLNKIIIAAVMPLVPGVPITNAIRDLMAAQLIAGLTKGIEACLTAFAIGAGVALCLMLF